MHKIMEPTRDLKSYLSGVNVTQQGSEAELGDTKQYICQVFGDKLVSSLHRKSSQSRYYKSKMKRMMSFILLNFGSFQPTMV
jgi:hypothetical protein